MKERGIRENWIKRDERGKLRRNELNKVAWQRGIGEGWVEYSGMKERGIGEGWIE